MEPWASGPACFCALRPRRLTRAAWCFLGAFLVESAGWGIVGEDRRRCEQGNAQGGDGLKHVGRGISWIACADSWGPSSRRWRREGGYLSSRRGESWNARKRCRRSPWDGCGLIHSAAWVYALEPDKSAQNSDRILLECRPVDPIGRTNQVPSPSLRDHVLEPRSAAWIDRSRERAMFAGDTAAMVIGSVLVRNGMEMDFFG